MLDKKNSMLGKGKFHGKSANAATNNCVTNSNSSNYFDVLNFESNGKQMTVPFHALPLRSCL